MNSSYTNQTESVSTHKVIIFNINLIATGILTIIGLFGNPYVIYNFTRKQFLKVSIFRYLIASIIADTVNLLSNWPLVFPDVFLINELSLSCKIFNYFFNVPYQVSPWILGWDSIDLYLSIKGIKSRYRKKFKYQLLAILFIVVFISIANVPLILNYGVDAVEGCMIINAELLIYLDIWNGLLSIIIPFIIMCFSAFFIWLELLKKREKLREENKKNYETQVKFFKILCIMDIYLLVCYLPYSIDVIVNDILSINSFSTLSFYIVNCISNVFPACNVLIYFIFNKLFRK